MKRIREAAHNHLGMRILADKKIPRLCKAALNHSFPRHNQGVGMRNQKTISYRHCEAFSRGNPNGAWIVVLLRLQ
jgi:hypothetical protein